ncbi:DUF6506 family protein [Marinobacter sp. LN3S78]|uniref:DUF6506 family protein n=1 Tax=Marinobacter sp. LN3S78 TaxID=3382300 RepID=UPI00387AF8C8
MALKKFGFIVTGDRFTQKQGTKDFSMTVIGVLEPSEGLNAAEKLVEDGVQLIELCGGFSPVWVGRVLEAIDYAVPIGVVAYGPESIDKMYKLFLD